MLKLNTKNLVIYKPIYLIFDRLAEDLEKNEIYIHNDKDFESFHFLNLNNNKVYFSIVLGLKNMEPGYRITLYYAQ